MLNVHAPLRQRLRRLRAVLVLLGGALAFVLFSPAGAPAQAAYSDACYPSGQYVTHLDPLSPVSDYKTWVFVASDTSSDGLVGVCVLALGGQYIGPQYTGDVIIGAGVAANLVEGDTTMTGVLVQPKLCAQADPWADECVTIGTSGAEASTSGSARICVHQVCQRVN